MSNSGKKETESLKDLIYAIIGGSALGAITSGLTIGLIALLCALGAVPTGGASLIPPFLILLAWGIGLGGGATSIYVGAKNLHLKSDDVVGWIALGIGLIGVLSTVGAIVGTFVPIPIFGTIAGAAAGAVLGTIAGVGLLLCTGLITGLVKAVKNCIYKTRDYEINDDFDSGCPVSVDDEPYVEFDNQAKKTTETCSTVPNFIPADIIDLSDKPEPKSSCTIF